MAVLPLLVGPTISRQRGRTPAGFALQHHLQPRERLPRAGIADPSIGGHAGQALGGGQLDQLAHLGAKVSQVHRLPYHCSMSSNGCGNPAASPPGSAGAADVAASETSSRATAMMAAGPSGADCPARSVAPGGAGQTLGLALGRAHFLYRRVQRCLVHLAPMPVRRRRRARRCSHRLIAGLERSRVGTSR